MNIVTIGQLSKKLGIDADILKRHLGAEPVQIIDEQSFEPKDELAAWVATIPGVTMSGYMLVIAKNRKSAAAAVTVEYLKEAKTWDKFDPLFSMPPQELIRIPLKENETYLIWNGDY